MEDLDSWDQDHPVDQAAAHLDLEDPAWDPEVLEWGQAVLEWALSDLADLAAHVEMDHEDLQVAVPTRE